MRKWLKRVAGIAAVVVAAAVGLFAWFVWWPVHSIPALEKVDQYVWLDQGWGESQDSALRERYYYTAQGTSMPQGSSAGAVRYDWFVNLELPLSKQRFADPDHMRRYRFVVDPKPTAANPDQLPIGFTKHFDPRIGEYVLDITCAACHTGEIHYTKNGRTQAIRIDGGPAMHAFTDMARGNFVPELAASMINTVASPWKFDRFAKRVLGDGYPRAKPQLRAAMRASLSAMLHSGQNNPLRKLYPVYEGFGRTDALGRIGNTAFGDHLVAANYHQGDAPVSYPYVWNIWKFDWVQYNGSVSQPLARNVGEALGVGAIAPLRSDMQEPLPHAERFRSSVDIPGLMRIEHALQLLKPPRWPEPILGAVDRDKAARGKELFEQRCRGCHGPHISEPARAQATRPAQARRTGVADRGDSAGAHRHRSHSGTGIHGAPLRPDRDRTHERSACRHAAAIAHPRVGPRRALPVARGRPPACRARCAGRGARRSARGLSGSGRQGHSVIGPRGVQGDR